MEKSPDNRYPSPAYAWYTVFLLLVVYTFSFIDRQILGLLGPAIIADFGISDTQFGLLTGYAFAVFYTAFGLICARISDSRSRRGLIAIGLTVWSLMTATSALARNFTHLFLMRIGVGVGEATLAPAANSIIADSFPKEKLATALSVYAMGIPVGSGIAFIVGGQVIQIAERLPEIVLPFAGTLSGWQKTFLIVGLPGLLLAVFVMLLTEPTRKGKTGAEASIPIKDVVAFVKSRARAISSLCLGVSMNATLGFGTAIFATLYFVRIHGLTPAEVGLKFGLIVLVTGAIGLIAGGRIADKLSARGRKDAHMLALMIAPIGYTIPAVFAPQMSDVNMVWILFAISTLFVNLPSGIAFAGLQVITPNQMRGQVVSLYVLATNIVGYGGGPLLLGWMVDSVFQDPMSVGDALSVLALISGPASLLLFIWGRKAFARAVEQEEERVAQTTG